jgi:hypothetical protein
MYALLSSIASSRCRGLPRSRKKEKDKVYGRATGFLRGKLDKGIRGLVVEGKKVFRTPKALYNVFLVRYCYLYPFHFH